MSERGTGTVMAGSTPGRYLARVVYGTLGQLVRGLAEENPAGPALLGSDGLVTTRADLAGAVASWAARIERLALSGDARIAVALPNGVSMATSFLGIAANAVCAPLNPTYTEAEADFHLTDLEAGLVVVEGDSAPGVRAAAERLGIPVLDLDHDLDHETPPPAPTTATTLPERMPGDIALILHTSGTTSRPKQVPLTHSNLLASARSIQSTLRLDASDRCANVMPLIHVHGLVACLLASLHAGSTVVCTAGFDPQSFFDTVARLGCTWYSAVPTIHQAVLSAAATNSEDASQIDLRFIRSASSSLPPSVMTRLEQQFGVPVIEAYGMTEAANQIASNQLPPGERRPGSVGIAAGPEVSVVDADGNHLEAGSVGELVIRGDSVMGGYLSPLEANDDAFFGEWFRTGDQGTIDTDGVVTLTGRLKELINRAGEKIAPREIDEALLADPDVSEALAFALPHPTLGEDVAAVVVPLDPDGFDESAVLDRLRLRLAEHKIPRQLVVVDELPKGAIGKPARIGLAEKLGSGTTAAPSTAEAASMADPLVAAVAAVLQSVLRRPTVGPDDNFVAIGGDSLSALAAASAIEETFGVPIPAGMLLGRAASPAALADAIRAERELGAPEAPTPGSLSSAAKRLWTMQQIEPTSSAYNVGLALRLRGVPGGPSTIEEAIERLVDRHRALRTRLAIDDGEVRATASAAAPTIVRRELVPEQLDAFVSEIMDRPIDLEVTPLNIGIGLLGADEVVVVVVAHHALVDGPSRQILRRDLVQLLAGRDLGPVDEDLPRPVRRRAASTEFWRAELGDLGPSPDLPAPSHPLAVGAARSAASVSGTALERLRELARRQGVTLFSLLLAAHAETLRRVGAQDDLVIAVPVTNRRPSDDTTVGMFIETVPVRVRLDGVDTVDALLGETHRAVADALAHGDVPFDELVEIALLHRSTSARPLAGTMCQLRPPVLNGGNPPEFSVEDLDARPSAARFDLAVDFVDADDHLEIVVEHDATAIDDAHGRCYASRVAQVLDGLAAGSALTEIDVRSDSERTPRAVVGHDTDAGNSEELDLVAALDGSASVDPDAVAIIDGDRTATRAELVARSKAFAAAFDRHGACESRPIGIALPRGIDAIAAMIGAWRVGAPYVTFDSSGPSERDRAVAERCELAVVVAEQEASRWNVPSIDPSAVHDEPADWQLDRTPSTAWILSTSGSSGEPKLVPGSMVGLVNRLRWGQRFMPVTGPAAHRAPLVFVDHVAEIFEPLLAGQPLVVIDDDTVRDPRRFAAVIEASGVTRLLVVPTLMRMLSAGLANGDQLASLRVVVTSGEPLPSDVADAWLKLVPGARLINIYGSTEVSADATAGGVIAGDPVTVGSPIDGFRVEVVSSSGPPSPPGCIGEIWISGVGVMDGYVDHDTKDLLVERDLDGQIRTWYRTGDRGRFDAEGRLTVLGRADSQLKVRGVRIDPMEIEAVLRSLPGVTDAVVQVTDDVLGAVLAGPTLSGLDPRSVRVALAGALPPTHVPTRIQVVGELPRTAAGKLDRASLSSAETVPPADPRCPTTSTERWLEQRWSALIPGVEALSVDDDFFSIGGQSLTAVELFVRIEDEFGLDLPAGSIFEAPTIESLARMIDVALDSPQRRARGVLHELSAGRAGSPTVVWSPPTDVVELHEFRTHLGPDVRLVALESQLPGRGERAPARIEDIAARQAQAVMSLSLTGSLVVGGNSFGGLVALELARQLRASGLEPDLLVIVDSWPPGTRPAAPGLGARSKKLAKGLWRRVMLAWRFAKHPVHPWSRLSRYRRTQRTNAAKDTALATYDATEPLDTPTLLFTTDQRRRISGLRDLGWSTILRGPLDVVELDGSHGGLMKGTRGEVVGTALVERLRSLDGIER